MNKLIYEILDPIVYKHQFEFYILRNNLKIEFESKNNKELKQIIKATKKVRYWNCGWITYILSTIIREIAQEVIKLRRFE